MLLRTVTQNVGERRRYRVDCDGWLRENETLSSVTVTVDSGTATVNAVAVLPAADNRSFEFYLAGGTLGDVFNAVLAQTTSYGQVKNDHIQFTIETNGGTVVVSGNQQLMLSLVGPPGPTGPASPAGASVIPSGGDDYGSIQATMNALAPAGGVVTLDGNYICNTQLVFPAKVTLDGRGSTTITMGAFRAIVMSGVANAKAKGITFDLTNAPGSSGFVALLTGATACEVSGCSFLHPKGEINLQGGSTQCIVRENIITQSLGRSITLDGVADNLIANNQIVNGASFGVFLENGANHNLIQGNYTTLNAIELVGIKYDCHDNRVIGNHAEGTGDNGISVTGQYNVVVGNICRYCAFNGIGVYGSHNTIAGNNCIGNGKGGSTYAGIAIQSAFGGTGQNNTVAGNTTDDDQGSPTQEWGINLNGTSNYALWQTATVFTAGEYCSNGINIYFTAAGGTSGSTPPTWTSGAQSDGGVSWQYITSWSNAFREPTGCGVGPNSDDRSVTGTHVNDTTVNNYNSVITREYSRHVSIAAAAGQRYDFSGIVRHMAPWVTATPVTYGATVYSSSGSSYRCSNVGGTTANEPSHSSGTVTGADGIAWTLLALNAREYTTLKSGNAQIGIDALVAVGQIDKPGTFTNIISGAGDPNGVVTAPKGSLFLRSDGGAGTTLYVREAASNTVWQAK